MTFSPSTHPILALPYTALYKKPSRSTTLSFKVIACLICLEQENLNLSRVSLLFLSIVKLYIIKLRYLLTDTSDLVSSFTKSKDRMRRNLATTTVPFLLDINKYDFMEEESVLDARELSIIDCAPDFSMNEIEIQRNDDTFLSEKTLSLLQNTVQKKRVIDDVIDLVNDTLRIKNKPVAKEVCSMVNTFHLPSELDNFFKRVKREEIETGREEVSMDMFEPYMSEIQITNLTNESVDHCYEEVVFPENFIFNEFVENKDKKEKGMIFLTILKQCTDGRMKCYQENSFENIHCQIILSN